MPDDRIEPVPEATPNEILHADPAADPTASPDADPAAAKAAANAPAMVPLQSKAVPIEPAIDPVPVGITPAPPQPSIRLEKKHPLAIRWMHWINFPVLFTMIWSGIFIYWNDSDNAYQHPHQVYRVGLGHITLFRFFPDWFYHALNVPYRPTVGLGFHFFFMWIFFGNGLLYVLYTAISGEWRYLLPTRYSIREAIHVTLHDLGLRKDPPPRRKFNGAQQIAYTSVILMGVGSLVTGLAIYKPTQAHWITSLLGGYEMARWLHFWLTIGYCAFFLIHISQVVRAGWNNFRAMVTGYEIASAKDAPYVAER